MQVFHALSHFSLTEHSVLSFVVEVKHLRQEVLIESTFIENNNLGFKKQFSTLFSLKVPHSY